MLDKNGFKRKTYADLIDEMSDKARELYGENINVSPRSPMGLILRLFAWFLALAWETLEKVYYSNSVSKSEGVQLDSLGANRGVPREPDTESYVSLVFKGNPGFIIPEQTQFSTETDIYFSLTEDVTLNNLGDGSGRAVSIEKGIHTIVGANTITIQAEPMEEITSVTNPGPSAGGRDRENDKEYKPRLMRSTSAGGKATTPAIISALAQTSGVRSYNVIINNKNAPDEFGNPEKSVHAYVLGGERQTVAETIFNSVAGGIETVGQELVMVEDISGIKHEVRFDYATEANIQIQLSVQTNSAFPVDGEKQLKDALIRFIGGEDTDDTYWTGLSMGQDVIHWQSARSIQVPGIDDISLLIGKEGGALAAGNVTIAPREVARTGVNLIEVTIT